MGCSPICHQMKTTIMWFSEILLAFKKRQFMAVSYSYCCTIFNHYRMGIGKIPGLSDSHSVMVESSVIVVVGGCHEFYCLKKKKTQLHRKCWISHHTVISAKPRSSLLLWQDMIHSMPYICLMKLFSLISINWLIFTYRNARSECERQTNE